MTTPSGASPRVIGDHPDREALKRAQADKAQEMQGRLDAIVHLAQNYDRERAGKGRPHGLAMGWTDRARESLIGGVLAFGEFWERRGVVEADVIAARERIDWEAPEAVAGRQAEWQARRQASIAARRAQPPRADTDRNAAVDRNLAALRQKRRASRKQPPKGADS
jgi:hypothetical protein